jgi:dethiobiotin synthetase
MSPIRASTRVPGLFITGTGTEVGKTYVAAMIARALSESGRRVGVYKPVASGCRREGDAMVSDDAVALWEGAGRPGELDRVCPQRFLAPLAPHLAAREEGRTVDAELLRTGLAYWEQRSDVVLVEGAGGLMSPLSDEDYVAELADEFGYPLVVVARNALGTINATLQTLITAATFREGLSIAGVVLNQPAPPSPADPSTASNPVELAARCVPPLLAQVGFRAVRFEPEPDWCDLAK